MENSNIALVEFALNRLGTPYVMGTNGKPFTKAMYADLVKRNPGGWFTLLRKQGIKKYIGEITTDCHGLIEWFVRTSTGKSYDITANASFQMAKEKGDIDTIPEIPGLCVRYPGHVGIYIGKGYVVEARGYNYGLCVTHIKNRNWTHWYKHHMIEYASDFLPVPKSVNRYSPKYAIAWLQTALNIQVDKKYLDTKKLAVDGLYGSKTANAVVKYWKRKEWDDQNENDGTKVWSGTLNSLSYGFK